MVRVHPGPPLFSEAKADQRAAAGWKPDGSALQIVEHVHWLPRFRLQALQRCSGFLIRRARGSTVATYQFQSWKLNRTSVPGLFRKQIVPPCGMGSMPSGFRQFHSGLAEQQMHSPCKRDQIGAAPIAGFFLAL